MRKRILTMFALILTAVSGAWAQSEWTNIVVNGDMEGTDVSCFYVKESAKSSNMYLAPITDGIGKDNSRAIKLQSSDKDVESWDTQFFIRLPYVLPTGTQYRFSFDYKTDKDEEEDVKFDFQVANEPSQYVWWTLDGWPAPGGTFNTGWQHYEAEFTVSDFEGKAGQKSEQGDWLMLFRTINFNLSANHTATEFIFDNVKVEILTSLIPTLTPEPVTDPKLMMLNRHRRTGHHRRTARHHRRDEAHRCFRTDVLRQRDRNRSRLRRTGLDRPGAQRQGLHRGKDTLCVVLPHRR